MECRHLLMICLLMLLGFFYILIETDKLVLTTCCFKVKELHKEYIYLKKLENSQEKLEPLKNSPNFLHNFTLGGATFTEKGQGPLLQHNISTSCVYTFSPDIENAARKMYLMNGRGNQFFANSPAIIWHDGKIHVVLKIWLKNEAYYYNSEAPPLNTFQDNILLTQQFNRQMEPMTNASLIGIATPKWQVGDGPIEPRLFRLKNRLLLTFNAGYTSRMKKLRDYTFIWDMEKNILYRPQITGPRPVGSSRDKHWIPYVMDDELYFVKNFDPLRVLHCTIDGSNCKCVYKLCRGNMTKKFVDKDEPLRGGTPLVQYRGPYFISVNHVTLFKDNELQLRYYSIVLTVFCSAPFPRIIYVSNPIEVSKELLHAYPIVREKWIKEPFVFPVGLHLEDPDSVIIGAHVNDFGAILLRLTGLRAIVEDVIKEDKRRNTPKKGAPDYSIQNFVRSSTSNYTGIQFQPIL